ncbi:hypothetical protein [Limnofasciculus baicalensis]|uniref:Uncharacterized protein n=1 Tax=Limnofasciculus baicalensis BBK-W-15 TaxID=2699891 RepID=A0AAE3GUK9_9CYAN|nr:hypothetical protein [Limnofasciculus baicalensis]MCP2728857.1 hypothetical protein [Limnofasciculus baicalensis BBK-W-15]
MPQIQNAKLAINHIKEKSLSECTVACRIHFFPDELALIKELPQMKFKLKCELWGSEDGEFLKGKDDKLWVFESVLPFPDSTPTEYESARFFVVLGDDKLNEDTGFKPQDEIYSKLILTHKLFPKVVRKTNVVKDYF